MTIDPIDALSPLDGRYFKKVESLRAIFSEAGLMRARVRVECAWVLALAAGPARETFAKQVPSSASSRKPTTT
jgi:adenylosuccinate lyase